MSLKHLQNFNNITRVMILGTELRALQTASESVFTIILKAGISLIEQKHILKSKNMDLNTKPVDAKPVLSLCSTGV
jgi:hypothetical protein